MAAELIGENVGEAEAEAEAELAIAVAEEVDTDDEVKGNDDAPIKSRGAPPSDFEVLKVIEDGFIIKGKLLSGYSNSRGLSANMEIAITVFSLATQKGTQLEVGVYSADAIENYTGKRDPLVPSYIAQVAKTRRVGFKYDVLRNKSVGNRVKITQVLNVLTKQSEQKVYEMSPYMIGNGYSGLVKVLDMAFKDIEKKKTYEVETLQHDYECGSWNNPSSGGSVPAATKIIDKKIIGKGHANILGMLQEISVKDYDEKDDETDKVDVLIGEGGASVTICFGPIERVQNTTVIGRVTGLKQCAITMEITQSGAIMVTGDAAMYNDSGGPPPRYLTRGVCLYEPVIIIDAEREPSKPDLERIQRAFVRQEEARAPNEGIKIMQFPGEIVLQNLQKLYRDKQHVLYQSQCSDERRASEAKRSEKIGQYVASNFQDDMQLPYKEEHEQTGETPNGFQAKSSSNSPLFFGRSSDFAAEVAEGIGSSSSDNSFRY